MRAYPQIIRRDIDHPLFSLFRPESWKKNKKEKKEPSISPLGKFLFNEDIQEDRGHSPSLCIYALMQFTRNRLETHARELRANRIIIARLGGRHRNVNTDRARIFIYHAQRYLCVIEPIIVYTRR